MKKTVDLDLSRLLGYRLALSSDSDAKLGSKAGDKRGPDVGIKAGPKVGRKVGFKVGPKIGRKVGFKVGPKIGLKGAH